MEEIMDEKQNLINDFEELLNGQPQEGFDIEKLFDNLFNMPDADFNDIAPGLLENYAQTVNNAQNKLALVQMLNANGDKAEDVIELFNEISAQIAESEGISQNKKENRSIFVLQKELEKLTEAEGDSIEKSTPKFQGIG